MEESMDSVIKLFGKTIHLTAISEVMAVAGKEGGGYEKKLQDPLYKHYNPEPTQQNQETRIHQKEARIDELDISDQQNLNSNNTIEKTLKKPDKILPCPRCKSMDTKFCYFNNYNVNQPRHFCKCCQRYWTDGGSMRNVPVGAGRRKSKTSAASHHYHYHHITIPDDVQPINHSNPTKLNGTVLRFGSMDSNVEGNNALNSNFKSFPHFNETPWLNPFLAMEWRCSGLNSSVLGKRTREEDKSENCLWIPIEGHEKAEKRSQVLCANPAALSRSLCFHERS